MKKTYSILLMMSSSSFMSSLYMMLKSTFISLEYPLMNCMPNTLSLNMMMDWTSMMFMSTVTFITMTITIFSKSYMTKNEMPRFIPLMMLFVTSMMMLILSNNLIMLIIGWDGLGISSYILVAYYQNFSTASSSTLTIMTNRIGDIAIISSIALILPTLNMQMNHSFPKMTSILILLAAMTKSAQYPFSAWLPAAMAAPTPISALVHSSTLVTAGVYLLMRINSPFHPLSSFLLMITASFTTMMAGISANWEQDMKKIIALSTLSQIAIMLFSISINANKAAFFHLITHALFKSTMFMCAGVMINLSSYQDMRATNSMMSSHSTTTTLGMSAMALMGLPFMSGFYSKDMIIELSLTNKNEIMFSFMILSLGMTSCYTMRMLKKNLTNQMLQKPDISTPSKTFNTPLMIMNPLSITTGALLSWWTLPHQSILLTLQKKNSILTMLLMGITTGMLMSFNKKKFLKKSEFAISLWFNHSSSCHYPNKMNFLSKMFNHNDISWLEMKGPQGLKKTLTSYSSNSMNLAMILSSTMMLSLMLPIMTS